ncbi:MAG: hypothetical protein WKG01_01325 [Kofleriaceae bacterium]
MKEAKQKFDIKAHISSHPLVAVGAALALGALLGIPGSDGSPSHDSETKRGLGGAAMAGIAGLLIRIAKDVAVRQLTGVAKDWMGGQEHGADASRDPSVEALLQRS